VQHHFSSHFPHLVMSVHLTSTLLWVFGGHCGLGVLPLSTVAYFCEECRVPRLNEVPVMHHSGDVHPLSLAVAHIIAFAHFISFAHIMSLRHIYNYYLWHSH
jgi:hypothetical protein